MRISTDFGGVQHNHFDLSHDGTRHTTQTNDLFSCQGLSSNQNITAADNDVFSKQSNQIGGQLSVNSDTTGSAYIMNNLAVPLVLNGDLLNAPISGVEYNNVGFVSGFQCGTANKTVGTFNLCLAGLQDLGSTEDATINQLNAFQIPGMLPGHTHTINEQNAIHVHPFFGGATENYALKSDAIADLKIHENSAYYLGDKNTDDSHRLRIDGGELVRDKWITGNWVTQPFGSGSSTLDSLTDVELTALADTEILAYDSSLLKWKNIPNTAPVVPTILQSFV